MSSFRERVIDFVKKIPKGKVVSYGQVAAACGNPRAARQVGGVLRSLPATETIPWWRVVNQVGYLSIKGNFEATKELQAAFLRKEGVEVASAFTLNISKYRWRPE